MRASYSKSQNETVLSIMKVLYIGNGLTHYYNLVLSRLNNEPEIELVIVVPSGKGENIGDGVHQTKDGINFKVIELEEIRKLKLYTTFVGLAAVLLQECPSIVVVNETYLHAFLFGIPEILAMKRIHAGLILKSIPFRCVTYQDSLQNISKPEVKFTSLPYLVNALFRKVGLTRAVKRLMLRLNKMTLNLPDAHVNYVEAYDFWDSYGVTREKIFITRNSPDTDLLLSSRKKVEKMQSILPTNPYRLIHVGRLVEWKRVDMLIRSFAKVRQRFPSAELLIIGNGPEEENLKKLANELQIEGCVNFLGGVYDPELLGQYYLASSLYVLAGMGGLSINEAMCFGLPILCSVCDGTEKALVYEGSNGMYFRDGDEADLIDKVIWFFENVDQLSQMGLKSEEIIRTKVNIRTVLDGYLQALHFVANKKKSQF